MHKGKKGVDYQISELEGFKGKDVIPAVDLFCEGEAFKAANC